MIAILAIIILAIALSYIMHVDAIQSNQVRRSPITKRRTINPVDNSDY
jgi:hypothetical protein